MLGEARRWSQATEELLTPPLPQGLRPGGRFDRWDPAPPTYVVADVDGTLVGPDGSPTPGVVAAAARAVDAGLKVGFATGRMRLAVESLQQALALTGPHVLHNGAEVRADGQTIATWPLTHEGVSILLDVADTLDLYVELYVEDGFVVSRWDERARPHWDLLGHLPLGIATTVHDVPGPVTKATFAVFDPEVVPRLVDVIDGAGLRAGPAGSPVTPHIMYVNATDRRADKGAALAAGAGYLAVPLASVVAVGDASNDLAMFTVAGTAVAMGQAEPDVIEQAHLVAPAVTGDGVATLLDAVVGWR